MIKESNSRRCGSAVIFLYGFPVSLHGLFLSGCLLTRRRTPGIAANKKSLEVNLPESSRKFITCIRKYLLFYLKLLEEAKDICTLDKAFISIRADKRVKIKLDHYTLNSLLHKLLYEHHRTLECRT